MAQRSSFSRGMRKAGSFALLTVFAMAAATGLGYMADLGNQRVANDQRASLTETQKAVIETAIEQDECGMIHPRISGLCYRVQRGEMTLYP